MAKRVITINGTGERPGSFIRTVMSAAGLEPHTDKLEADLKKIPGSVRVNFMREVWIGNPAKETAELIERIFKD